MELAIGPDSLNAIEAVDNETFACEATSDNVGLVFDIAFLRAGRVLTDTVTIPEDRSTLRIDSKPLFKVYYLRSAPRKARVITRLSARSSAAKIDPALSSARLSIIILFALMGLSYSSWLARLPVVREMLGLSTAELGVVFLAGAVGSLICVTIAGPLVVRYGGRAVLNVSALGIGLAFVLEGLGPTIGSVWVLAAGIFLNGSFVALTNVPQNVESAAVERGIGKPILPLFHAAYSIGAVAGSLFGAVCAYLDVPIMWQFALMGIFTVVVRLMLIPKILIDTQLDTVEQLVRIGHARRKRVNRIEAKLGIVAKPAPMALRQRLGARRTRLGSALGAWRERRTLMIGLIIFSAALSEGSANNWLSIAVVDGFAKPESTGAVMLAVFLIAMTAFRLIGPSIIIRLGRVATLQASTLAAIVGLLLFGFSPSFTGAIFGIVLWGIGAALVTPLAISAASDEPLKAAARVSVVSAHGSIATLAAPPVLGFLAQIVGARVALTTICVFLVIALVVAKSLAQVPARDLSLASKIETPQKQLAGTPQPDGEPGPPGPANQAARPSAADLNNGSTVVAAPNLEQQ